ncbi:MAG: T9SS type A sorting domain-containing protein [Ignavibacteria bacterium]|nr:T9SS type A sorting domain-containing protein [Ignavibacteria bacterium]
MKKLFSLFLILFFFVVTGSSVMAQLTGVKTIPGTYATFAAAITDLNAQGVGAGGVTFNVAAGYIEQIPAGGFVINIAINQPNASNPVIFQKSGLGANPMCTTTVAGLGTVTVSTNGSNTDAFFKLNGTDWITFDAIDLLDNYTGATTGPKTEAGYMFCRASATDGCKNITIKNCRIVLALTSAASLGYGIYSSQYTSGGTSTSATSIAGRHENIFIDGNTIERSLTGMYFDGTTDAVSPYSLYNNNIQVGVSSANTLIVGSRTSTNTTTQYGIYAVNCDSVKFNNNTVRMNAGTNAATHYGIFTSTGTNSNADIIGNNVSDTINSAGASQQIGIANTFGTSGTNNTVNIQNNTVSNCAHITATGGPTITYIQNLAGALTINISGNTVQNNYQGNGTTTATGTMTGILNSVSNTTVGAVLNLNNNTVSNLVRSQSLAGTGQMMGIQVSGGNTTSNLYSNNVNNLTNNTTSSTNAGITFSPTVTIVNIYNNTVINILRTAGNTTGATYGILATNSSAVCNVYGNTVYNINNSAATTTSSATYGYYNFGSGTVAENFYNNTIYNISCSGASATGVTIGANIGSGGSPSKEIYNNLIYNITGRGQTGGLRCDYIGTANIYRNYIRNILSNTVATTPASYGLLIGANGTSTTRNTYNNVIHEIYAPLNNTTLSVVGIWINGGVATRVYYNSVYLDATSSGTNFHTAALWTSVTPTIDMRNNILINKSTPNGSGLSVAYQRSSTTIATHQSTSDRNNLYAGATGPTRVIFFDGTNSDQTLAAYKTRVSPSEANSVTENTTFTNTSVAPYSLTIASCTATQCESNAGVISTPSITTDFSGNSRYPNSGYPQCSTFTATAPDIGAHEFAGIGVDMAPPSISYTLLTNTSSFSNRSFTNVTITDVSGVNVNPGTMPRCYYKRSADGNVYIDNSPGSDGWKYVEANGTSSPFDFTIDYTLLNGGGGVVLSDIVQYFVVAEDLAGTPNVGINNGTFNVAQTTCALDPSAFPIGGTINSYQIVGAPLSGSYTVGLTAMREILGKDLKYEPRTRKVKVMVPYEEYVEKTSEQKNQNRKEETSASHLSKYALNTPLKEVEIEETYYELTENGRKYEGPNFVSNKNASRIGNNTGNQTDFAGVYPTITAAVTDLNTKGVSGPVTFVLTDGNYAGETYPIQFNSNISGISAVNTVTLKPQSGVSSIIPGNINANATIRILSNYVTIDGSNSGGTDRSLTIQNNSVTTPNVILVGSIGTTPITNVMIKNCTITNGANTSSAIVIGDATIIGNAGYFNTITVQNNLIERAYMGLFATGGSATANGFNLVVADNSLTTSGASSIRLIGLYAQYTDGATFSNNTISNIANTTDANFLGGIWAAAGCRNVTISGNNISTISSTASTSTYVNFGVFLSTGVLNGSYDVTGNTVSNITTNSSATTTGIAVTGSISGINIQRNKISNVKNTNSAGWGANGIYLGSTATTGDIIAQNNMIFDIAAYGYLSGSGVVDNGYGIVITAGTNHKIYNNSVLMNTSQNVDGLPAALNITSGVTAVSGTDVRNNVLVDTQSVGTNRYAIYSGAASNVYSNISYNCYRSSGPNIGIIGGINRGTISDWRTGTGKDIQSFSSLPLFVSGTDLHIQTSDLTLNGRGTYIAGVNSDYDGDSRPVAQSTSVGPVDVGCDQYTEGAYNPNICAPSGDDFYDGGLIAVEVVSGSIGVTEVRQYPGVRTPNNTLLKNGREFEIKNPVKKTDGTDSKKTIKTKRDGTSGGQTDAMAVNVPWIYWELSGLTTTGAVVRFYFNEEMLATILETDLQISYWTGSAWDNSLTQTVNTTNNYIELTLPNGVGWGSGLFAMASDEAALPVVLSSFDAAVMKREISLSWTTESEINNRGFSVERRSKLDAQRYSAWKEVTFVEGKGNTTTRQSYGYSDKKLNSGTYQYRLKQVDFNGNYEYHSPSNNADLVIGKPGVFDISQNYPNPSNPTSNIDFQMPFDGKVSLRVYDILGKEVATLVDGYRTADFYTAKFDGTNLSTGVYFYRIIADSGTEKFTKTLKMILVK